MLNRIKCSHSFGRAMPMPMMDTRGGSRLVGRGVSVSRSHVILLTNRGGGRHMFVSFYLHKG